ncbi:hypothetical protein LN042_01960 [Kitasatospora sp. RB6PN24]|uniref:hypothetical protein n=1 Tax=Kitasatospora humi TaxID=2893891 RepID=UPI001E640A28|nr:hypothetical protein [Kitasatospora humi]MCC9305883.1 hypothetical protein [Kitasatospora humi]
MSESVAQLVVTVRPSIPAAWFHHVLTRPVIELDGTEHPARWGANALPIEADHPHLLKVFFRYRGQRSARLGEGRSELTATVPGSATAVRAQLGVRNSSTFRITGPTVQP